MSLTLPIPSVPVADWATIARRFAETRALANMSVAELAVTAQVPSADIEAFELGEPVLGTYELDQLAECLGVTAGTWFCGDQEPMFRGAEDGADKAAAALGAELMTEYLAVEALVG